MTTAWLRTRPCTTRIIQECRVGTPIRWSLLWSCKIPIILSPVQNSGFWLILFLLKSCQTKLFQRKIISQWTVIIQKPGIWFPARKIDIWVPGVQLFSNSRINNLTNILTKIIVRHPCRSMQSFTTQDTCGIILC